MPSLLEQSLEAKRERARLVRQSRENLEKDDRTAEDVTEFNRIMGEIEELGTRAEQFEQQHNLELEVDGSGDGDNRGRGGTVQTTDTDALFQYRTRGGAAARMDIERTYELDPTETPEFRMARTTNDYRREFRHYLSATTKAEERQLETRALSAGSDPEGGYTVAPIQWTADLIKSLDDNVLIRPLARVIQVVSAKSLGVPSLDADPADADWTSELDIGTEDSTMDFGDRELNPHPLAKFIKVSKKLLRSSALNMDALVRDRLSYKVGITEEKGFLTGSGASEPLGVFTASDNGIATGRDVSTGNTTTSIGFDGLHEAKYSLKMGYWRNARWIFHRDALKQIAKLKDGEGQYVWRESVRVGEPDMLLGLPFLASEYAPNTFTTGLYVGILGDFSFYWIAEALDPTVQVLVELYAGTNQNGYIIRTEVDGMPVLGEAFARVKLA